MGDICSDTEAELRMMMDAYKELRNKNPNHELLKLVEVHSDEGGFNFTAEYITRCARDTDKHDVHGYARYTAALKAAANGLEIRLLDTVPPCEF